MTLFHFWCTLLGLWRKKSIHSMNISWAPSYDPHKILEYRYGYYDRHKPCLCVPYMKQIIVQIAIIF